MMGIHKSYPQKHYIPQIILKRRSLIYSTYLSMYRIVVIIASEKFGRVIDTLKPSH